MLKKTEFDLCLGMIFSNKYWNENIQNTALSVNVCIMGIVLLIEISVMYVIVCQHYLLQIGLQICAHLWRNSSMSTYRLKYLIHVSFNILAKKYLIKKNGDKSTPICRVMTVCQHKSQNIQFMFLGTFWQPNT